MTRPLMNDNDRPNLRLRDIGERALIHRIQQILLQRTGAILMLDDAAIVPGHCIGCSTWITTDPSPIPNLVQVLGMGTYYHAGWLSAVKSLSDVAAMGARPTGLVVAVEFPPDTCCTDFDAFFQGFIDCCSKHGTTLLGGNLKESSGGCYAISCALGVTDSDTALKRGRPNPGDVLFVVDREDLGGFWAGIATHVYRERCSGIPESILSSARELALTPRAKVIQGQALLREAPMSICMDNSDGLLASAIELVSLSTVDAVFDLETKKLSSTVQTIAETVGADPRLWMLGWGSYHLLCSAADDMILGIQKTLNSLGSEPVIVGSVQAGSGLVIVNDITISANTPPMFRGDQFVTGSFWQSDPNTYVHAMMTRSIEDIVRGSIHK